MIVAQKVRVGAARHARKVVSVGYARVFSSRIPPQPIPWLFFSKRCYGDLFSLGFDVGRGTGSFDEEGRRFVVSSISMKIWHVKEYSYQLLPEEEYGHFFSSEG